MVNDALPASQIVADGLRDSFLFRTLCTALLIQRQVWKVQCQPQGRSLDVCVCDHESSLSVTVLHS
jgi:hypothetical protein